MKSANCPSCGNPKHSVFIGGDLLDIRREELEDWLRNQTIVKFTHILKTTRNPYGHVHFRTHAEASKLFHKMVGKEYVGPKGRGVRFRASTHFETKREVEYELPAETQNEIQSERRNEHEAGKATSDPLPNVGNLRQPIVGNLRQPNVMNNQRPQETESDSQSDEEAQPSRSNHQPNVEEPLQQPNVEEPLQQPNVEGRKRESVSHLHRQSIGKYSEKENFPRKRRASGSLADHQPMLSTRMPFRVCEYRTTYRVVVYTPDINQSDLMISYDDNLLSIFCKFPLEEETVTVIEDNIPAGCAVNVKLPERIESHSVVVQLERGVATLILKKLEGKGKDKI